MSLQSDEFEAALSQRRYYEQTAAHYDAFHPEAGEHEQALMLLRGCILHDQHASVLDIGAGTGRALLYLRSAFPALRLMGIEPVEPMRQVGYAKGVPRETLVEGDATAIAYDDGAFDVVCAFGVLHHVPRPRLVLQEMLRVARRAIFLSDMNSFGLGSYGTRRIKRMASSLGLTRWMTFLQTGGKFYRETVDDGIWYPYSLFDDYPWLRQSCSIIHIMNLDGGGACAISEAPHIALYGKKAT